MLNLAQNQSEVFFKLYATQTRGQDPDGYYKGTPTVEYGKLQSARLCVSASQGSAGYHAFGTLEGYDRTMTTADIACPIDVQSILWLDGADTSGPHNYVVTRKAAWKNSVLYAVKQVTVSHG